MDARVIPCLPDWVGPAYKMNVEVSIPCFILLTEEPLLFNGDWLTTNLPMLEQECWSVPRGLASVGCFINYYTPWVTCLVTFW